LAILKYIPRSTWDLQEFFGVDFDLTTLKQTLAFVLRIDERDYLANNDTRKNDENMCVKFMSLRNLEDYIITERVPLMVESAATYALLKEHRLFKEIIDNDYKLILK